jgi:teichuronic acid biosynthesis glycosyltransferase TuaG
MVDSKFKATIVIPTINRPTLSRAILSAQNQIGNVVDEIIIAVDARFRDQPLNLPEQSTNIPYRVVYGDKGGVANTLNTAIQSSKSNLISWLSDDDEYTKIKILNQVNVLHKIYNANYSTKIKVDDYLKKIFLISNYTLISDVESATLRHDHSKIINSFKYEKGYQSLALNLISGCTCLFSSALWQEVGGFRSSFETTQDYILWKQILDKDPIFIYSEYSSVFSHIHPNMGTKSLSEVHKDEKNSLREFIYSGLLAASQEHNLSLVDQRQLYFTPPSEISLFNSYLENENVAIRDLCYLENKLNTICLLITQETSDSNIDESKVTYLSDQFLGVLSDNLLLNQNDYYKNYKKSDFEILLDSYWLSNNDLKKIFGESNSTFSLTKTSQSEILLEAISNYRYVAFINLSKISISQALDEFINHFKKFDRANELFEYYITFDKVKAFDLNCPYAFFVRDPFLADSGSLNKI